MTKRKQRVIETWTDPIHGLGYGFKTRASSNEPEEFVYCHLSLADFVELKDWRKMDWRHPIHRNAIENRLRVLHMLWKDAEADLKLEGSV